MILDWVRGLVPSPTERGGRLLLLILPVVTGELGKGFSGILPSLRKSVIAKAPVTRESFKNRGSEDLLNKIEKGEVKALDMI